MRSGLRDRNNPGFRDITLTVENQMEKTLQGEVEATYLDLSGNITQASSVVGNV